MPDLREPFLEQRGSILVVRDDLIPGGSKTRAIPALLEAIAPWGGDVVYASPASGYAQVALAVACKGTLWRPVIFTAKRKVWHARTLEALSIGADVIGVPAGYLNVVRARARDYCAALPGRTLLPFGLDHPVFLEAMAEVARGLEIAPPEVWSVAGSGALTRSLQLAWPDARFYAVRVGTKPNAGRAEVFQHGLPFEKDAPLIERPPFPSCLNYDAKAWAWVSTLAKPGALFWNVAG